MNRCCTRFTLVELLVVIAIIAVLAGLLLPALAGARHQAKKTKARVQMKGLQTAISMYESDYGVLPVSPPPTYPGYPSPDGWVVNRGGKFTDLINILQGANPRNKRYLDIVSEDGPGVYNDPWGQPYQVALDGDYDGDIPSDDPASPAANPTGPIYDKNGDGALDAGDVLYEKTVAWSCGKDTDDDRGRPDDVTSWGN